MDVRLQAKLLRAIQEREIDRVGGSRPVPVDIRILATSNRDLAQAVKDHVPRRPALSPQRREPEACRPCASGPATWSPSPNFARSTPPPTASPSGRSRGKRAAWPATAGRAMSASWKTPCTAPSCWPPARRSARTPSDSPDGQPLAAPDPGSRTAYAAATAAESATRNFVGQTVATMEQQLIIDTLEHCLGNRTHAANILGISIRTLRNKLKEYSEAGVSVPAPQGAGAHAA
jgi:two-component system response regulator FlrC